MSKSERGTPMETEDERHDDYWREYGLRHWLEACSSVSNELRDGAIASQFTISYASDLINHACTGLLTKHKRHEFDELLSALKAKYEVQYGWIRTARYHRDEVSGQWFRVDQAQGGHS